MELKTFTAMFGDQNVLDFKKLKYKFGPQNLTEYLAALQESFYRELPLLDFKGRRLALLPAKVNLTTQLTTALAGAYSDGKYGIAAMEDEIMATLSIEQIGSTRESVRKILNGGALIDGNEDKAYGIKRGWILSPHRPPRLPWKISIVCICSRLVIFWRKKTACSRGGGIVMPRCMWWDNRLSIRGSIINCFPNILTE
ncbi:MAG: hypothetical protein PVH64_04670 [Bacillota bacterium]